MDDYEALLNRVSKQLAHSNFASQRQPRSSSRRPRLPSGAPSRIQKPASGRNSPASRPVHRNSAHVDQHSMPTEFQQFPGGGYGQAPLNMPTGHPLRPHSWHQSAFPAGDFSQDLCSSSYPNNSVAWPLTQSWNVGDDQELSPGEWPESSKSTGMNQGPASNNMYTLDTFGQSPGLFEVFPDSTVQQPTNLEQNLPQQQTGLQNDYFGLEAEVPFAFDAFYGPTTQPTSKFDLPRLSFDSTSIPDDLAQVSFTEQESLGLLPATSEVGESADEELIGLGLYDKAEDTARQNQLLKWQRPTLLFGDFGQPTGKGLKLEETWQPPTEVTLASKAYGSIGHATLEEANYGDEAVDSSNDGLDDDDETPEESFFDQQLITPIDNISFANFPLSLSDQQFLFGDTDVFANGLMESQPKDLLPQGDYEYGWLEQNGSVQFV